jgi:hypothetical protein
MEVMAAALIPEKLVVNRKERRIRIGEADIPRVARGKFLFFSPAKR